MIERTLVLIKPDGVQRSLCGEIVSRFEKAGFRISGMKMKWIDEDFAKKHYKTHANKPFFVNLKNYITKGPVLAMVLEGVEAVEVIRKIVGSTEPRTSPPGTIRGDYCHVSYGYADKNNKSVMNLIHASGSKEEAKDEIKLWFDDNELHLYKTSIEEHIF